MCVILKIYLFDVSLITTIAKPYYVGWTSGSPIYKTQALAHVRKQEYSRAFCGAEQLALFPLLVYSKWKGSKTLFYIYWNSSHWSDSFSYHKTSYIPTWFHSRVTCSHNQFVSRVHIDLDLLTLQVAHDFLTHICMWKGTLMFTLAPDKKKSILTYAYSIFW